jgi:hypothetical protein
MVESTSTLIGEIARRLLPAMMRQFNKTVTGGPLHRRSREVSGK